MTTETDRIRTTHAGSLPRPDDLARMMYDVIDRKPVDPAALDARITAAVEETVTRQRDAGIDVVSDGEMGKFGFSNYVAQRFEGFGEPGQFLAADMADAPDAAAEVFGTEGAAHLLLPVLDGPMTSRGTDEVDRELATFRRALGDLDPADAFVPAVTPGQVAFNFPNRHYRTHQDYIEAAAAALAPEYRAIVDAGFLLQLDSPDSAMAFHCSTTGSDVDDPLRHLEASVDVLNGTLAGLPEDKIRYHVCWGNYRGPHHRDVSLAEILDVVLRVRARYIYLEAANPRHEHEWELWRDTALPEDKALIVGVIDTKTNHVEHPRLVAQRLRRYADLVGRDRIVAGTDCGFATFVGFHPCAPSAAWLKLAALAEGARLASAELW